jgi:hypothetical protein
LPSNKTQLLLASVSQCVALSASALGTAQPSTAAARTARDSHRMMF